MSRNCASLWTQRRPVMRENFVIIILMHFTLHELLIAQTQKFHDWWPCANIWTLIAQKMENLSFKAQNTAWNTVRLQWSRYIPLMKQFQKPILAVELHFHSLMISQRLELKFAKIDFFKIILKKQLSFNDFLNRQDSNLLRVRWNLSLTWIPLSRNFIS